MMGISPKTKLVINDFISTIKEKGNTYSKDSKLPYMYTDLEVFQKSKTGKNLYVYLSKSYSDNNKTMIDICAFSTERKETKDFDLLISESFIKSVNADTRKSTPDFINSVHEIISELASSQEYN